MGRSDRRYRPSYGRVIWKSYSPSPDGTESVLATESEDYWWLYNSQGYENWTFTSARHWGESSQGEWTLQVRDKVTGFSGTWNSWSIKAYGENIADTPGPGPEPEPVVGPELISVVPNSGTANKRRRCFAHRPA